MNRVYRWYFHFNALHNMTPDNLEQEHIHSFLVVACMEVKHMDLKEQNACEQAISAYLQSYRGKYLNELDEFKGMLPTIENICEVLYARICCIAREYHIRLIHLEVGDSPVAMYAVGEKLLLGSTYREISDESYQKYKQELELK